MSSMILPRSYQIYLRNVLRWFRRNRKFNFIFKTLMGISIIWLVYFSPENTQLDGDYKGYSKYLYKRTSGLVKELFPHRTLLPYQFIPFEDFRYPIESNMSDVAFRTMNKQNIGLSIINEHPFRYIHNPIRLCSMLAAGDTLSLLILIKSSVSHFNLRNAIRKTWGKEVKCMRKYKMAFLLGYSHQHQYEVDSEHKINGDIIQEDFIDVYRNNTFKTIMAYNWASVFCSNADVIFFLDDDMILNLSNLEKYVSELDEEENQNLFTGIVAELLDPVRDNNSKSFVPWHEYPFDNYPKYLAGSAIFASMSVVKRFQAVFPYVRYFDIDDVYLGIVAHKLNIVPSKTLHLDNDNPRNIKYLSQLIANHGYKDSKRYIQTYLEMLKPENTCTKDII